MWLVRAVDAKIVWEGGVAYLRVDLLLNPAPCVGFAREIPADRNGVCEVRAVTTVVCVKYTQ